MGIYSILNKVLTSGGDVFCDRSCVHMIFLFYCLAGCSGVGVSVFAYKYDRYAWYWIFAVAGGVCAGANSFIGCCCQNIKRRVKNRFGDLEIGEEMALPMMTKPHKR